MSEEVKVVPDEAQQDTQEYVEQMVAKAEGKEASAEEPKEQEQPAEQLILGKFKTTEDLAKSYQELEKKLGDSKSDEPTDLKAEQPQAQGQFSFADAEQEFNETGSLSDKTIETLEKQGVSKQYIDTYMQGLNAMASQFEQKAFEATNGEDNYKSMQDWITNNLSEQEVSIFNNGVSADDQTALFTIKNMYARFQSETKEPNINLGDTNVSGQGVSYESLAQMKADMRDPRYDSDPAFRKQVQDKISRSKII